MSGTVMKPPQASCSSETKQFSTKKELLEHAENASKPNYMQYFFALHQFGSPSSDDVLILQRAMEKNYSLSPISKSSSED